MAKSQVDILADAVADLYKQLSLSLSRESELREVNADLANRLNNLESVSADSSNNFDLSAINELVGKD